MRVIDAIKQRKSVKKFMSHKVDWRKIIRALDAVRFAPMTGNLFTMKFILVKDKEKIQNLAEACQQGFVANACYVVVAVSDDSRVKRCYAERGSKFARQQAGAAMQNFFLSVQEAGLATCWVGHFVEEIIKRELKIPANAQVEALFPVGYEFEKSQRKKKIDMDNILYFNNYNNKKMKNIKKLDT